MGEQMDKAMGKIEKLAQDTIYDGERGEVNP
jgi:hypothetical protein